MTQKSNNLSLLNAIFLVSGTSIGAGMLAQPVAASLMGFVPTTLMMILSWAFMAATALVLVEVCLWMPKGTHVISMADHFLGPLGKITAWLVYLFMAYLSLTAYISGGGDVLRTILDANIPTWGYCVIFALVFGLVIEISSDAVSKVNTMLFSLLIVSYVFVVFIGAKGLQISNLVHADFSKSFVILPLLLASFSFQMMVPSLVSYLDQDRKKLRISIILGTGLSFLIYTIWNATVLGHESSLGNEALAKAYQLGLPPTGVLSGSEQNLFSFFIQSFSFFALVTSFIGISWGLFDFLADGLKVNKKGTNRAVLWLAVILPPLYLASASPHLFISALESTGAYGDTILNAIIPILMFWIGRKYFKNASSSNILGSPLILSFLFLCAIALIGYELLRQFWGF